MKVRTQSLYTLADVIRGNSSNQDKLTKSVVRFPERKYPVSAVVAVISCALQQTDVKDFNVRAAGAYVFCCYVSHNNDLKMALMSTITAPPDPNPNSNEGVMSLFRNFDLM